jgi:uncharacterized protein
MIGHLTEEECRAFLQKEILGRIGCSVNGETYVVPVNYLFDGANILAHSQVGKKIEMMRKNPNVCLEVDNMQSLKNWESVIAWGKYVEITNPKEKWDALHDFVNRLMHFKISETAYPPEMTPGRLHPRSGKLKTVVYKIVLEKITGRYEKEDE